MKTNFNSSIALKSALLFIVTMFTVISVSAFTNATVKNQLNLNTEPVKNVFYQSIETRVTDKSVFLDWNTVSELNNSHFEVERSIDMDNFKTVAIVLDGFTTTGTGKRYAFKEDAKVVKNGQAVYYRLKQIDVAGNISYSEVVKVQQTITVQ